MRRSHLQPWLIILLVLARLVLGETAHAMPHAQSVAMQSQQTHEHSAKPCTEHAVSTGEEATAHAQGHADCCKHVCDCACAYGAAVAFAFPVVAPLHIDSIVQWPPALARADPGVGGIFRPPALSVLAR